MEDGPTLFKNMKRSILDSRGHVGTDTVMQHDNINHKHTRAPSLDGGKKNFGQGKMGLSTASLHIFP
jgi:hypothetical protein